MLAEQTRAWIQIHLCVLLWGFTAILGALITMASLPLVLWRMGLVAAVLLLLPGIWRALRPMSIRLLLAYAGVGVLVALHWLTFYAAIKLANASVAVTCIATVPIFLAAIEPLLTGRRFRLRELLLGLLVLPGIMLVVGGTPQSMNLGIVVGIASAIFVAFFAAFNKRLILRAEALTVTALEMAFGALFLALLGLWVGLVGAGPLLSLFVDPGQPMLALPAPGDAVWLLVLAFACTLLPFALSLKALRQLSAWDTALAVNLEPLYAIVLAMLILSEQQQLGGGFYLGAGLILVVVFLYPLLQRIDSMRRSG